MPKADPVRLCVQLVIHLNVALALYSSVYFSMNGLNRRVVLFHIFLTTTQL